MNGKKLDPPVVFEDADGIYDRTARSMEEYSFLIRELAYSAKGQQADGVARVRHELEKNFLTQSITYEVVEYAYNPIERWRSGQLGVSKSIAVFHASVSP
ncbi:MAG: hypothetical protein U1A23_00345 [Candidatus Sungbacteria bacterium]|nr:hypothetical protein [Candidatus Sungbacteria bacterium]